jgi:hypothetical protein
VVEVLKSPMFLVFAFLTLTSVVSSVAHYWFKTKREEIEGALKQEMIQRGMSADEIVKVIAASRGKRGEDERDDQTESAKARDMPPAR